MELRERYRGSLIGLAVGDALGTTVEFQEPGSFQPLTDIVGGGPFNLPKGAWTDDTSMALCLAASLVEQRGFDPLDQMRRYLRWRDNGYMSSTGTCFDIGNTVNGALQRFTATGDPNAGSTDPDVAGNGSLMRLAPVALAFAQHPSIAIELAAASSRVTHAAPDPVNACRFMAGLIVGALTGASKDELLSDGFSPIAGAWKDQPLGQPIDEIARGSYKTLEPARIRGTGHVVRSLEAALWCFHSSDSFEEGALLAANLGDDADTTAAIYGQLTGAHYGLSAIPKKWLNTLVQRELIVSLADQLFQLASEVAPG